MNVFLTPAAEADLISIGDWLSEHNPELALPYIRKLRDAASAIGEFPGAGAPRPHWGADVRIRIMDRYIIAYRIRSERVEVLRIVHGSRDLDRLFSDEQ